MTRTEVTVPSRPGKHNEMGAPRALTLEVVHVVNLRAASSTSFASLRDTGAIAPEAIAPEALNKAERPLSL